MARATTRALRLYRENLKETISCQRCASPGRLSNRRRARGFRAPPHARGARAFASDACRSPQSSSHSSPRAKRRSRRQHWFGDLSTFRIPIGELRALQRNLLRTTPPGLVTAPHRCRPRCAAPSREHARGRSLRRAARSRGMLLELLDRGVASGDPMHGSVGASGYSPARPRGTRPHRRGRGVRRGRAQPGADARKRAGLKALELGRRKVWH